MNSDSTYGNPCVAVQKDTAVLKLLKWFVIVVVGLVAVLFVVGYHLSPKFTVTRSASIAAPGQRVYALISDPREWR